MSCLLLDPPPSPLAGGSVAEFRAPLPRDLSGILIEPLAESTQGVGEIESGVTAPVVPVLPSCCSGDSDVPLAVLAKVASRVDKDATHEGEGLPPLLNREVQRFWKQILPDFGKELQGILDLRGRKVNVVSYFRC